MINQLLYKLGIVTIYLLIPHISKSIQAGWSLSGLDSLTTSTIHNKVKYRIFISWSNHHYLDTQIIWFILSASLFHSYMILSSPPSNVELFTRIPLLASRNFCCLSDPPISRWPLHWQKLLTTIIL